MKIFKTYTYILFSILFAGCSDDFLNLAPISNSNVENFYQSEADFENAIYGAYSTLTRSGLYHDYMQLVGDLRSDNSEMGTTASTRFPFFELSEFRDQVSNPINENIWNDHYLGILRVNELLERIEEFEASVAFKERIIGEARFLRGLFYFNLVRVFGDVPLVTSSINSIAEAYSFGRTEKAMVYDQIVFDLEYAAGVLPVQVEGEEGRATWGASKALLGKVYLTMQQFEEAADALSEVINSGEYELLSSFEDLWLPGSENHSESIFDVQFQANAGTSTGSYYGQRYTPYQYPHLPYFTTAGGYNIPTTDLIDSFEEGDLRKEFSIQEFYIDLNGDTVSNLEGRFNKKFIDPPIQGQGADENWPVIRYADVLLMYAEVLNERGFQADGPAFDYMNEIRSRAGLPDKTSGNSDPSLSVDSQEEFRLAIEQERRSELAFEGHRWFDLVRTGRAVEVLDPKVAAGVEDYQIYLPIPQTQIDINPDMIKQNTGY